MHLIKLISFCKAKKLKTEKQPTKWENVFAKDLTVRAWFSKYANSLYNFITTENNPNKKCAEVLNRSMFKEDFLDGQQELGNISTAEIIRVMQIKTTVNYHFTPSK